MPVKQGISADAHSDTGPSGAKRWASCPASVLLFRYAVSRGLIPQSVDSPASIEGTQRHEEAENYFYHYFSDTDPEKFFMEKRLDGPLPKLTEGLEQYTDEVIRIYETHGDFSAVELRVPLWYRPENSGTIDFLSLRETAKVITSITICDLKWGFGVVNPVSNPQLSIYAQSTLVHLINEGYEVAEDCLVTMTIVQPRVFDEPRRWKTTWQDLQQFNTYIEKAYQEVEDEVYKYCASAETCQWCPVKHLCQVYTNPIIRAKQEFFEKDQVDLTGMSDEKMAELLQIIDRIKTFEGHIKDYFLHRSQNGTPLPPLVKVGQSRRSRKFKDEEKAKRFAMDKLGPDAFVTQKLRSVAQLEKELEKLNIDFSDHWEWSEGSPVIQLNEKRQNEQVVKMPRVQRFEVEELGDTVELI